MAAILAAFFFPLRLSGINWKFEMLNRAVQPDEAFPVFRLLQDQHDPGTHACL